MQISTKTVNYDGKT